jgi:hypothetical protein
MSASEQRFLDYQVEHGGYGLLFGDCIEFAAPRGLVTESDRVRIEEILDYGLLRKAKPYFMELISPEERRGCATVCLGA